MPEGEKSLQNFVDYVSGDNAPILVGGQAVNLWCLVAPILWPESETHFDQYKPFTSKDCDVFGDRTLLTDLAKWTDLKPYFYKFGQPSCCIGYLYKPEDPEKQPVIEILSRIRGLTVREIGEGQPVVLDGKTYRSLNPILLLKAKLANAAEIDQQNRQDERHVRMLIPCVRAYLSYTHSCAAKDPHSAFILKKMLTHCLAIVTSEHASKIGQKLGIDLWSCFPVEIIRTSALKSVQNFWNFQLAKHFEIQG